MSEEFDVEDERRCVDEEHFTDDLGPETNKPPLLLLDVDESAMDWGRTMLGTDVGVG